MLTKEEVLRFVGENDVKFVRLAFTAQSGAPKNCSVMADALAQAFDAGLTVDARAIGATQSRPIVLRPDPSTLAVLPWRPQQGRVARLYCDVFEQNGTPSALDARHSLRLTQDALSAKGIQLGIGACCMFYLFEMSDRGLPTSTPQDSAGYLDLAPLDRGENVRRGICLSLDQMGVAPVSSHHEFGPGQNAIELSPLPPLEAADALVTFRGAVRAIASHSGLYASFDPRPIPGAPSSTLCLSLRGNAVCDALQKSWTPPEGAQLRVTEKGMDAVFSTPSLNPYLALNELCAHLG